MTTVGFAIVSVVELKLLAVLLISKNCIPSAAATSQQTRNMNE